MAAQLVLTREDLLEEFRKFSLEIRNLHQNLQLELQGDLHRMFSDRASSPLATPNTGTTTTTSWLPPSNRGKQTPDSKDGRSGSPADGAKRPKREAGRPKATEKGEFVGNIEAMPVPETKTQNVMSDSSQDGSAQVHPAPADLRGAAVSGFALTEPLEPPSCVPDEVSTKVSPREVTSIIRPNSKGSDRDSGRSGRSSVGKRISWSDEYFREGSNSITGSQTLHTQDSWLPQTYSKRTSGNRKVSVRSSMNSEQTVETQITSYSEKAKTVKRGRDKNRELRRQDTELTEVSARRTTIYMVYKGEMTKWEAMCLFFAGDSFDYFMGVFLFLNAISIGLQVQVMCSLRDQGISDAPMWLRIVDFVFCLVFLTELVIRICIWRCEYFRMPGWQWNYFDILVVGFSVIDEISKQFLVGTSMQETIDSMGVLRMLRLARVVRLIRMVRLIPELKSMVYLILSSMWSFFWTLVLLGLLIYCVAVYYTEAATDLVLKEGLVPEDLETLKTHYGGLFTSTLSLFMAITGGDDWRNFVDLFKSDGSYVLNAFMFVIYISFVTLVMLNLVTGVFVEGAQRIVAKDKEAEITRNVRKLFHITDTDQSGEISWEEFEAQLDTRRMVRYLDAVDMNPSQAKGLFKLLDLDKSGELSIDEFVEGCLRLRVPATSVDLQTLKYDFEEITNHWASQFAVIGVQIANILDIVEKLSYVTVASLPEELILV